MASTSTDCIQLLAVWAFVSWRRSNIAFKLGQVYRDCWGNGLEEIEETSTPPASLLCRLKKHPVPHVWSAHGPTRAHEIAVETRRDTGASIW